MNMGDLMAESFRTGTIPTPDKNNKQTVRRRRLHKQIKEQTGGDPEAELDYCLNIIKNNLPTIQQYVMSRGEEPQSELAAITLQAFELRKKEAEGIATALDTSINDAMVFLEDEEATHIDSNVGTFSNYLGMYAAPIEIAASRLLEGRHSVEKVDNFVDPALIAGIVNVAGSKINSAELRRAAEGKPAGIIGFLGTGGTKAYNALRAYLALPENKDEKEAILKGQITSITQLRAYGDSNRIDQVGNDGGGLFGQVKLTAQQLADEVIKQKRKELIRKYLPIAIGAVVLLVIIVYFVSRRR